MKHQKNFFLISGVILIAAALFSWHLYNNGKFIYESVVAGPVCAVLGLILLFVWLMEFFKK